MATKGSSAKSWTGELNLKPGPCHTCTNFRGWTWDGSRWAIWCKALGVFYDCRHGCSRLEREPGSDDDDPTPAMAMSSWRLYGRAPSRDDEWAPPY